MGEDYHVAVIIGPAGKHNISISRCVHRGPRLGCVVDAIVTVIRVETLSHNSIRRYQQRKGSAKLRMTCFCCSIVSRGQIVVAIRILCLQFTGRIIFFDRILNRDWITRRYVLFGGYIVHLGGVLAGRLSQRLP